MSIFSWKTSQKPPKTEDEILKPIRLSIIGTPSAGKTFLVYNIFQLLKKDNFIRKYISIFNSDKGMNDVDFSRLTKDFENSFKIKSGTRHSSNKRISPFTEYEYHFKLVDNIKPTSKKTELHIRNIPGEMINTYFANRPEYGTINSIFIDFINTKKQITHNHTLHYINKLLNELIDGYPNQQPGDIQHFYVELCKEFIKYIDEKYNKERREIRIEPVERNFYSYLFFRTSSDILFCEDISQYNLPKNKNEEILRNDYVQNKDETNNAVNEDDEGENDDEVNLYNQRKFIETAFRNFSSWDNKKVLLDNKRLYYAFTKFDVCVNNPLDNYLNSEISTLNEYWTFTSKFIESIYNKNSTDLLNSYEISERIKQLKKTQSFITTSDDYLKYVFFTSSAYDNIRKRFRSFDLKGHNKDDTIWEYEQYFLSSLPLGIIEFLISLFTRSGFQPKISNYFETPQTQKSKTGQTNFNKLIRIINNE